MKTKRWIRYTLVAAVIIIGLLCLSVSNSTEMIVLASDPIPMYQIPIDEDMQAHIWKVCQENDVSYELVLSIYVTENATKLVREVVKSDIIELANHRNVWRQKGYPDEITYDLLLEFRWNATKAQRNFLIEDYVDSVTEYKSYLEQRFDDVSWMGGK
ncbi:MAG: hypothetical protein CVU86_07990 [Firmicutes bacterium HGW-Firmicutes-11]|nr:MAG: hypothetical protein CVU86_07990 [Firmicutes bacterium HGW-Firmicutes-11]